MGAGDHSEGALECGPSGEHAPQPKGRPVCPVDQPGASPAATAAEHGARLVIVNAEPTPYDAPADEVLREPVGRALPLARGGG
ncbi:hypothetical protein GCM10009716_28490 [Streptomyces sodiiphilus]|uniref:Uncharacterized protein n=1 Tax=Streptomyces sodiiphilus TaxID=226217 RepID=A0ABN2PEI4_9ACTN